MSSVRLAYENVLYPCYPRKATAPDRLAAVATMFGIDRPDPECARVLEIGCSDGANLIPLALTTPNGSFLGIDFAQRALALGKGLICELGLTNIKLEELDLTEFPADAGSFDYIIIHGVFSWVPPEVRTAIPALIQRHLSPNGVAFVDYNALPGGHLGYAFREGMLFHGRRFSNPTQQIEQARALLKLIIEANPPESLYRSLAEAELQRLLRTRDGAFFHDTLSEYNERFLFHDFITTVSKHGLQYLAEADVADMSDARVPEAVRKRLAGLNDLIEKEQYLDILTNREFRQTLLCRADLKIDRTLDGTTLDALWFSSRADESPGEREGQLVFRSRSWTVGTTDPLLQTALRILKRQPGQRLTLRDLAAEVQRTNGNAAPGVDLQLRTSLLRCVMLGVVEIHSRPASFGAVIAARPTTSPLARLQAQRAEPVTTLGHYGAEITDELARRLLTLLDGTRTTSELAEALQISEALVCDKLRILADEELLLPA